MRKLFVICLLAMLLCSLIIPTFAVTEPTYAATEGTAVAETEAKKDSSGRTERPSRKPAASTESTEATETDEERVRTPKDPFAHKVERAQQNETVKPTLPYSGATEATEYNGPAVIPPQPDPEIDYIPIILIGSGLVIVGVSVAALLILRKKSK